MNLSQTQKRLKIYLWRKFTQGATQPLLERGTNVIQKTEKCTKEAESRFGHAELSLVTVGNQ